MSAHILGPILQDLDELIAAAKRGAPGGVLTINDMAGIYRRIGSRHGCTPDDVNRWHEQRGKLMAA